MRRSSVFAVSLLALLVMAWPSTSKAQDTKTARGTVTAMAGDSLTVKVGANDMKFTVDSQTEVVAPGAGTRARRAQQAGQAGPKLNEVVKTGQAVVVTYREMGSMMHATRVQAVSTAGSSGGGTSAAGAGRAAAGGGRAAAGGGGTAAAGAAAKTATGAVKSVTATALTITAGRGDMNFTVDSTTRVVARGAGTRAAPTGGRTPITEIVKAGDQVSVTYHEMGGTMHVESVRVVSQAPK
jgi:hypothetical protein